MIKRSKSFLHNYQNIILLSIGIVAGSIAGIFLGDDVKYIKPIGDIFLNLLFTAVIPLIFFAISSSVANIEQGSKFKKTIITMLLVFLATTFISAVLMIFGVQFFPLNEGLKVTLNKAAQQEVKSVGQQITALLTTNDFFELLSRKSMLALIIFSAFTGFATLKSGDAGLPFKQFLNGGNEVMKQLLNLIMLAAPIGLGAYFAYLTGVFGPDLFGTYARSLALYYGFCALYFIVMFSVYAWLAGGFKGVKLYWKNNIVPSLTALGTCSSVATIPVNMQAAEKMGVPKNINNITMPLGASLHKDGSSIGAIIKIALVFALFDIPFLGWQTLSLAVVIALVTSIVEGGIPNGGYIGELFVVTAYGLPIEALSVLMIISTLIDPMATLLNATGDTVAAMLISRFSIGKNWITKLKTNVS